MAIEKINSIAPTIHNKSVSFGSAEEKPEVKVDEEKSMSMNSKIGLCAAAAIAIGGIILYAKKGKAPKSVTTAGGGGVLSRFFNNFCCCQYACV